ncbi:MAG TPA: DUF4190 domain-containing protein [Pyrinomonadaceae bacterium]|jgi:hypothetical protein|nr:DUF4190 domain-containing protein [Pyrinomonadaceae bacterium]
MKKCPNCQKEFPDTMRFCQTDGTPLVDAVEESQPEDPLKTTVVRQEDIAASIPPSDPFKTMVAGSAKTDESGDLLQLPEEEFDPLKTMVATPIRQDKPVLEDIEPEPPKFEEIKEEIKAETPSSPFSGFSQPNEPLPEAAPDYSADPTLLQPEPPKFNEPDLSPPSFGSSSSKEDAEDDLPQTVMQNPWDSAPKAEQSPFSSDSPFSKPNDAPMSSPFDAPKSSFDAPPSPFGQQQSSFDEPTKSPFDVQNDAQFNQPQQTPYEEPKSSFEPPTPSFQEPSNQFGSGQSQFDQANQGFGSQPIQSGWNPPPSPESNWQEQGLGANTPFQPPVVKSGQSQGLAIASIACGGVSLVMLVGLIIPFVNLVCGIVSPGLGLAAIITGFLARSRAKQNPDQYGGSGLALGGIITGALSILAVVGLFALAILFGVLSRY